MKRILTIAFCLGGWLALLQTGQAQVAYVMADPELRAALPACEDMPDMYRENCNVRQLRQWVRDHLQYPEEARTRGLEGRVEVTVLIDTLGQMGSMRLSRKLDPLLNAEALRIVQGIKDSGIVWLPAMHHGKKVISEYRIPVNFYLTQPQLRGADRDQDRR
ncbi:MAG: energy transducer TonB [Saprospiraceae bacterium]